MNFSDFGVKDESELEQDDFSSGRPTFGKDNQLTVIGWRGKSGSAKYYIVRCSECAKDPELFGDGVFRILKGDLKRYVPCGCSRAPKWSEDQYKIRIERKCKELGYIFHGFVEGFRGKKTDLKLECAHFHNWSTTSTDSLLQNGTGCPFCKTEKFVKTHTKDPSFHSNMFLTTGKFKEGTRFWKSERLDSQKRKTLWNYTCPVCSNDEYVQKGLCSGVFESYANMLRRGSLSCRCSPSYYWTKEQYEYRIKKKMQESNTTDEFVGFIVGFSNNGSIFTRKCLNHGEYATSINNFLNGGCSCPHCANQNQQESYINLIKEGGNLVALKFGIAKDSKQRIKVQNSQSIFDVEQHGVWIFPDVKSCKAAEKFIKQNLKCKILTKQEMPDGYTETTSVENLEAIIKIYEDFGGVRKIIESENLLEDFVKDC